LAIFNTTLLNRDLYLWLAIQSAFFENTGNWIADNCNATRRALTLFPGFNPRYERLCHEHLNQRGDPQTLPNEASRKAELVVQSALRGTLTQNTISQSDVSPVWLWVGSSMAVDNLPAPAGGNQDAPKVKLVAVDNKRRKTQKAAENDSRNPLILPFRAEALMSWSEMVSVNRSTDDEDDGNAQAAANDMDKLSITPDGQTLASRVKFDLDLPSASADDLSLGAGLHFPEWDYRKQQMHVDHCCIQEMQSRAVESFTPGTALRLTAKKIRRRLEVMRDLPRPQYGQESGDAIDLDAWIRHSTDVAGHGGLHTDTPNVYIRQAKTERSLATLLLADLSLSTDAYATSNERIIDVIRDALFVFGEALSSTGDAFSMWGFSSVRRQHVRLHQMKHFNEPWSDAARARVGAIRPGYYTRMGAAIRHASLQLSHRPERKRLLMLLTDGKPNDLDIYEGRYGLEDTRHAIHEAHAAGLSPFCVTIDETAHDYLPFLFGRQGYALVHRPQDLVNRLTQAWAALAR
jgi:nitric oxide reductase NorD protein